MEWKQITSASNRVCKMLKTLKTKKGRDAYGLFLVEGEKGVREAYASGADIMWIVASRRFLEQNEDRLAALDWKNAQACMLEDGLFDSICDTRTPQGISCAVRLPVSNMPPQPLAQKLGLYVYCDHLADPGNAGTIIRTADAVGAAGVLFSEGCADIYSPKVVRATMGSLFHLPVCAGGKPKDLIEFRNGGYLLAAGVLGEQSLDYREAGLEGNLVIVIGNEANGVTSEVQKLCDRKVIIPIFGQAESLNASLAAGILMYEWRRNTKIV